MSKKSVNAGVDASHGFEFQRNCALYLLLDNYDEYREKDFFLCIEHHDDFLYCFKSDEGIEKINAYQAKKMSGGIWKIDQRFSEIINKILNVGDELRKDDIKKTADYSHKLTFISNTEFELNFKPLKKDNGKKDAIIRVNETYPVCRYTEIHEDIKIKIEDKIKEYCHIKGEEYNLLELNNFLIQWVDFPRNAKAQKTHLIGLMKDKFPHVIDSKSAIDLLMNLFKEIELTYNKKHEAKLLDISKRVEGDIIKEAINVIEVEQKTFNLWREISKEVVIKFKFPLMVSRNAEVEISTAIELLKDMNNYEHQIIRDYVLKNDYAEIYYDYADLFQGYINEISEKYSINLSKKDFFFACLCSFVECYGG